MKPILKISEVFATSWKQTKAQIWVLAGLMIGFTILSFTLGIFTGPTVSDGNPHITPSAIAMNVILMIISILFTLGFMKNIFQALDGDEPQFSAYGQQAHKILTYFCANLLYSVIILIGCCLFIVPGIYLAIRLQFYTALIVDDNAGIMESLKKSWELTKGQGGFLFLLFLTMIGICILGLILLVVGLFVAVPLMYMMYAYTYRKLVEANVLENQKESESNLTM